MIVPVEGFKDKPGGTAENVPPGNPVIVGLAGLPVVQYVADGYVKEALSAGLITTVVVATTSVQMPLGGMVLVTVYVPGVLAPKSISPVLGCTITKPAGLDVKKPALEPKSKPGYWLISFWQKLVEA